MNGRFALGAALALAGCAAPHARRLQNLEATLSAQDSATAALAQWCARQHIAEPAAIVAEALPGTLAPSPETRRLLAVGPDEPVAYRHVALACGRAVLSVAHNWYVPGRLTPAMNRTLETTRTPFGKAAADTRFIRERLAAIEGRGEGCPAGTVLTHRALLHRAGDGAPISLVVECYTRAILR
ncbi:MAG: hypothetical protein KGL48_07910 [Sphingomonadales bacterium]|nr:hypothetical protein [Sphingomonadales bacterium]MDE2568847.1 hypothetical protein [Sphingomonadales bacterium]